MANNEYDAIVVGSGISGGMAAKELTEKGLKVLMLERGRNIEHIKDYTNAHKEAWNYPHRDLPTQKRKQEEPVLQRDYPLNESTNGMWASHQDSPYVEKKRFDWYRGYHVGGRSLLWGRQSYRLNEEDFLANAKEGIAVDWPIRYEDISPWYDYVERFAGISGSRDGLDVLPDGQYLPPIPLNVVEKEVAQRLQKAFGGTRHLIHGRSANITQPKPEQNRVNCQYRNKCWLGCPFGGYFSTQSSTLPLAMKTGNLTLRPFSIVTRVLYDKDKKRATGVEILDSETNQTYVFKSKIVFLNASALNSVWMLMNSATDVWDGGLGSSSGELGHNIMDHHFRVGASAEVEGFDDKYYYGRRPSGFYIPRFRNWHDDKRNYLRGFGYQGSASRDGWNRNIAEMGIGAGLKDAIVEPGGWRIGMTAFGEMLPHHDNRIFLNKDKKDKWGLPVLEMDVEIKENEIAMRKDMKDDAVEMFERAGLKNVRGYEGDYAPGMGIHEMGGARMGRDPKTSVTNKFNQVWDAPNVFMTDGACMTSASCVNPSLTYMALTARAANYAVEELKKRNL
ncbi:MAG: GMC family oxidoreductase [Pseudomonadota bacterium]|uniref:Choline dehydrogenase n=1 Tax=Marisediminitalea aggregata TaxID=634436 RepID=A0A1M5E6A5_9ALTE|nr:GMC family oxidoreductase [Marisediminitalea aggregata]MAP20583.1 GMC family oxidoreductase [Alteromonadaceae bacterium]MCP3863617.1 GMC family oxidoreductase [Aestuariibacter sp.]MEC7824496.1 GMC family oxidoreductase [Pseudomonadota bacterium]BBO29402.1 oxidoreductase [Alteromonas sp. I4]HBY40032.1 GMC family oxidoreductase [Alteromonas sp.]|tara:strand:- start:12633 stop:14318 length:1686 start_codon:yes stop_codon:yes gene_type:complete